MKRKILMILMTAAGVALYAYPHAAGYLSARNASRVVTDYDDTVAQLNEKERAAQWEAAVVYNENLSGNPVHDPFVEGSGMVMTDNYYEVLAAGESGMMGTVRIPGINVRLPVYHGTAEETLRKGAGHLEGSSFPVGGAGTHSVITAHTGLASAKMFTDLIEIKKGDRFFVDVLDKTLAYQVDQITVAKPEDTKELQRKREFDYCTLVTCTPYGVNSHRLLVRGVRTAYTPELEAEETEKAGFQMTDELWMMLYTTVGTAGGILILWLLIVRRRRKGQRSKETSPGKKAGKPTRDRKKQRAKSRESQQAARQKGRKLTAQQKTKGKLRRKKKTYWWEDK